MGNEATTTATGAPATGGEPIDGSPHAAATADPASRPTTRMGGWQPGWRHLPLLAMILGVALRVWLWAANWPLWLDEQMLAVSIRDRGLLHLGGQLENLQSAPLGWLWLERLAYDLFGSAERGLRLVPAAFGIGTVVVAYLIGRRWLGTVGAFVFVMLCSVNLSMLRYSGELKQYSADTFFALLLLGLAGWVVESPTVKRMAWWWGVAAIAAWFSMGAILILPGCALILVAVAWHAGRWRSAVRFCLLGLPWLICFAAHYALSIRYTVGSDYLQSYWQGRGFPSASAGPLGLLRWVKSEVTMLSGNPLYLNAGWHTAPHALLTLAGLLFWLSAAAGMVVAARRRLPFGLLLAAPVATAFLLALLRVVPLAERLALWFVPGLFLAVAGAVEYGLGRLRGAWTARPRGGRAGRLPLLRRAAFACAAAAVLVLLVPLTPAAVSYDAATPGIDDRAAVQWMRHEYRPGDIILPITSATRALDWYDPTGTLRPARMVISVPSGPDCDPDGLAAAVRGYDRVMAYASSRYVPYMDTWAVVGQRLAELGTLTQVEHFGSGDSIVYLVDLRGAPSRPAGEPGACVKVS